MTMTSNASMTASTVSREKQLTKHELTQVFLRSITYNASFNYERQLNMGWTYSLMPVLRKLYGDKPEEMKAAMARHLEFSNITPFICTILYGITAAMEEERANDEAHFDTESINAVKIGLMGPLSAIGDSVFFGVLRPIAASIGAAMALEGNVLGPILFFLIFNIPNLICRWVFMFKGYELGASFLTKAEKSGAVGMVFKGASILGLMVIGAMIASNVSVPLAVEFEGVNILDQINGIIPNLLSLGLVGVVFWMLEKDVNSMAIILILMAVGIIGAAISLF